MTKIERQARAEEFTQAAKRLSPEQQVTAMESLLGNAHDTEAGIIRQMLADPSKPLTPDQQIVFEKYIEPSMVEKCSLYNSCKGFTLPGQEFCESCAIKLG